MADTATFCPLGNHKYSCLASRIGDWIVVRKLGEGGFGQVYKVKSDKTEGKFAALKAEPNDFGGGSAIKLELAILQALTVNGDREHVPSVFHAAKHRDYSYMVMTLLGENIQDVQMRRYPKALMSTRTWTRIGIQCLYSVKLMHDCGFIHRDIKPNNFVVGRNDDVERARIVHVLDFGLARAYAVKKDGKWVARRARGTSKFRGTRKYCSPNVHNKKEQGRHDDLWSLFYVIIEMHCGLPWQTAVRHTLEVMKLNLPDKSLVQNLPVELNSVLPHLRTLDCYQRPNYSIFYDGLLAVMKRLKVKPSDPYDWEDRVVKSSKPAAWEDSEAFFRSDPVGINRPPPRTASKKEAT